MHGALKDILMLAFIAVIAILFTLFTIYRPGATRPASKAKIVGYLIVGVIIAAVLLASQHWNDPTTQL